MSRFKSIGRTLLLAWVPLSAAASPTASFSVSPAQGPPPLSVTADGSGSSGAVTWSWDWGDGSGPDAGITGTHVYGATGTYVVTLSVADNLGATASTTREITCISAGNLPPVAVIQSAVPPVGQPPAQVTFEGAGHDDTGPLEHRWDFGDGSAPLVFSNVPNHAITTPTHSFPAIGTYPVKLRVRDPENVFSTHSMSYLVTLPPADNGGGGGCGATGLELLLSLGLCGSRRRICRS